MWDGSARSRRFRALRWYPWRGVWMVMLVWGLLGVWIDRAQPATKTPKPTGTPRTSQAPSPAPPGAAPRRPATLLPPSRQAADLSTVSTAERALALSLEEAIRLALQHNLDIARERYGPPIARTEVERGRAAFDPTIGIDTLYSQTQNLPVTRSLQFDDAGNVIGQREISQFAERAELTPRWTQRIQLGGNYQLRFLNTVENVDPANFGTTSRIADPRFESRLELSFTQPLLRNFGIAVNTASIRQAEKAELIAEQQLFLAVLNTIFTVQQRYWDLVFRIQELAVRRESQKLAEDFLAENKVRVELGTLAPIELVQAQTRVKTREGDVIQAESDVGQAEDLLKEIVNFPAVQGTWEVRLLPKDVPPFVPITSIPVEEKVTLALKHRPDFLQSQLDIAIREIARNFARNQRLPQLDLVGRSSLSAFGDGFDQSIGNVTDTDGYEWAFGLQFQYPLGNRLARNDLLRRDLELQQALLDQRRIVLAIVRDVRQAIRAIETASKSVEVSRQAVELARTQLEAEQEKFRLGLSTSFNVLEFQEDLSIARSNETRALSDYNIALARLDQVTGKIQYDDFLQTKPRTK